MSILAPFWLAYPRSPRSTHAPTPVRDLASSDGPSPSILLFYDSMSLAGAKQHPTLPCQLSDMAQQNSEHATKALYSLGKN